MTKKRKPSYPPAPWHIVYFKRLRKHDRTESRPGMTFLNACPTPIRYQMLAIAKAVADAPPPAFGGGGKWEAMSGDMADYFQVKVDGFDQGARKHWRLFCLMERSEDVDGLPGPCVIVITGLVKPYLTKFTNEEYATVRALGDEFLGSLPRSVAL